MGRHPAAAFVLDRPTPAAGPLELGLLGRPLPLSAAVGLVTPWGGVAHVPLSAVIMISELAGSYDLLVPLMLSAGAAHAVLRRVSLYRAQRASKLPPPDAAPPAQPTVAPNTLPTA